MILFSVLPALIYIYIVYLSTPFNSINLNKTPKYLIGGFVSTSLLLIITTLVPISKPIFLDYSQPYLAADGTQAFIQVGFIEEFAKFLLFLIIFKRFSKTDNKNSTYILFSCMLVSTGFAMSENIIYSYRYPHVDTLLIRSFSALLMHMVSGIVMGYFIAIGYKNVHYNKGISEFNIWMKRNPKYKKITYILFGIFAAVILHGIYDFNFFMQYNYGIELVILYLLLSYFLFKNLKNQEFGKNR